MSDSATPDDLTGRRKYDGILNGLTGGWGQFAQFTGAGVTFVIAGFLVWFLTTLVGSLERSRLDDALERRDASQSFLNALQQQRQHDAEQRTLLRQQFEMTTRQLQDNQRSMIATMGELTKTQAATLIGLRELADQIGKRKD